MKYRPAGTVNRIPSAPGEAGARGWDGGAGAVAAGGFAHPRTARDLSRQGSDAG